MLCDSFIGLAFNTWNTLKDGRSINFQFLEETITDINMFNLKFFNSGQIFIQLFSKPKEGENGADWEWWFKYEKRFIGFRVQAKIINLNSDSFEHLHYQSLKSKKFQSDKIIENALSKSPPRIPLYCFYIYTDDSGLLNKRSCHKFLPMKDLWGCSLASAFEIVKLRSGTKQHLKDIEQKLTPWHSLVCYSKFSSKNPLDFIEGYVKEKFELNDEIATNLNVNIPNSFITENPPDYITFLSRNEGSINVDSTDDDLRGVILFSLSDSI